MTNIKHVLFRVISAGMRIGVCFIVALVILWIFLSFSRYWSDRRIIGTLWFYSHDVRYWPEYCGTLLWIAVIAFVWRLLGVALVSQVSRYKILLQSRKCNIQEHVDEVDNAEKAEVREKTVANRFVGILFPLYDLTGRLVILVAVCITLKRSGISFANTFRAITQLWHWLFDPIGLFILQGPWSPLLKDMPFMRFIWLPLITCSLVIALFLLQKHYRLFNMIKQQVQNSWVVSYIIIVLCFCISLPIKDFLNWFLDGFYRVPVTLFMASGRITWPLFVIPSLLIVFLVMINLSRRNRLNSNSSKKGDIIHE